jgi:drug/metabolite transporter (DMT)-like permease
MAWGELGLAALFFMARMEPDLERVRGRPLTLAIRGWALSLVLGLLVAAFLYILPIVHSPMMVALALSTTALGARRSRPRWWERECCPYCSSRLSPVFYCPGLFELRPAH